MTARVGTLTHKQILFVECYLDNGGNATQAAKTVGYKHPHQQGPRLMLHPQVTAAIQAKRDKILQKTEVTREWLIEQYKNIAMGGIAMAKYRVPSKDGTLHFDFSNVTQEDLALITTMSTETYVEGRGRNAKKVKKFKVDFTEPKAGLDQLGRIIGAFTDNVKHTGEVSLVERLQKGRERAKGEK